LVDYKNITKQRVTEKSISPPLIKKLPKNKVNLFCDCATVDC